MKLRNSLVRLCLVILLCLPSVTVAQTLETLFEFGSTNYGITFAGLAKGASNDFYGTTVGGVLSETEGAVYKVLSTGATTLLATFVSTNGAAPIAGLVQGTDGNYYGTTSAGGINNKGTIFRMTPDGVLTTLVYFNRTNGAGPYARMVQGSDGNFYGTTKWGGTNGVTSEWDFMSGRGTVFKMTPAGELTTLVHFDTANGSHPNSGLVQGTNGYFYGTTETGGVSQRGTLFKISPSGEFTQLIALDGSNGSVPLSDLIKGNDGNLYGTTAGGWDEDDYGAIFKITHEGDLTTLVWFGSTNGAFPRAELLQAADGNFYGTTQYGGAHDVGTVFKMTPAGELTTLVSFSETDGAYPMGGLVQGDDGNFYGTTSEGALLDSGTIFRVVVNVAPTNILLSNSSVTENQPDGSVIGEFAAVDPDATDSHQFTLVAGAGDLNNASFAIDGNQLKTAAIFDFETRSSYNIRVRATDSYGSTTEKAFVISITDSNEPPDQISLSNNLYIENQPIGSSIGTFSAIDPNTNQPPTFTLVSGLGDSDNNAFTVSGNILKAAAIFDYETKNNYSIRVRATGTGGATADKTFTIAITDTNETPVDITLNNHSLVENQPIGSVVGTFAALDPDSNSTHSFALVSGVGDNGNATFTIISNSLLSAVVFNHESNPSYSVRVRATDVGGLTFEKIFLITVTDTNEAPTDVLLSNNGVPESHSTPATVGTLTAVDPDANQSHFFAFANGEGDADNGAFTIESNTLKIVSASDYETKNNYSIRVRATDSGGLLFEKQFTILVQQLISILGQPESQTVAVGNSASLNVDVVGYAPEFQWRKNGANIPGATTSSFQIPNFQTSDAARYDVVVSNPAAIVTSSSAWLYAGNAETSLPTISIVYPLANQRITNDLQVTISGTAKDAGLGLAQVFYRVNGGTFEQADGTASWSAVVSVRPGINKIDVKAIDLAGNQSVIVSRSFSSVVFSELTLSSIGSGTTLATTNTFGAPLDGAMLEVGRSYILTAIPAMNNLFSNWTGSVTSSAAKLTFTMQSNMVLTANFVTNSFISAAGVYHGLFSEATGVDYKSAGYASLKFTSKQNCTGKLFVDGNVISFSGKMNVDGSGTFSTRSRVRIADKPELTLNVTLDFAGGTDRLLGTIAQAGSSGWTAGLLAHRVVWTTNITEQATLFTNSYTMLVPGFTNGNEGPTGSGYGLVRVDKLGKTRLLGNAADSHTLKQGTIVSGEGYWPMFSPIYRQSRTNQSLKVITENKGLLIGWLQFTNGNGVGNLSPVGEVHWIKTGWTNTSYTAGFTNTVEVQSSRWLPPVAKSAIRAIGMTNVSITFNGGDLTESFGATYFVTTNTTLALIKTPPEVYPHSLRAALASRTGLVKGGFAHPENDSLVRFYGVFLQDQNFGKGFFMGPIRGGKVELEAAD